MDRPPFCIRYHWAPYCPWVLFCYNFCETFCVVKRFRTRLGRPIASKKQKKAKQYKINPKISCHADIPKKVVRKYVSSMEGTTLKKLIQKLLQSLKPSLVWAPKWHFQSSKIGGTDFLVVLIFGQVSHNCRGHTWFKGGIILALW